MTGAWMIYALAIGALIAIAAVSAEWVLKSAQRPVRFVWVSAIALTVIFTVVAPLRVEQTAATPSATFALPVNVAVTEHQSTVFENLVLNGRQLLQTLVRPVQSALTLAGAAPKFVNRSAGILWFGSSLVALIVMVGVYSRSMRESLRWPRMRVLGKNVRVAPDVGPAVIGMAPPEIVIPRWVLQRNPEEQRLVLEHEEEHVRAHDPILLVFACIAVALMPWHAALWFMWSRLRLAVELDCDSRVLKRGVLKPAYGQLLVELSSQRPWDSLAMPAFSWGSSHLEKRLVAMTARPARFTVARRVVSVGVVGIALLAACQSELPTAAQIKSMDGTAVAAKLQKVSDSVVWFVDGTVVSATDAKAIGAGEIGSIEVLKKNEQRPVSEIHISRMTDSIRVANIAKAPAGNVKAAYILKKDSAAASMTLNGDRATMGKGVYMMQGDSLRVKFSPEPGAIVTADAKRSGVIFGATNSDASVQVMNRDSTQGPAQVILRGNQTCTGTRVRLRDQGPSTCDPIVIVDGVRVELASFQKINPDRIESIEVIKGASAVNMYGAEASNGVISIKLKP
ncbi:MAG: M56 family metallopeptidase [Gemmatimonadaceae bacterium]